MSDESKDPFAPPPTDPPPYGSGGQGGNGWNAPPPYGQQPPPYGQQQPPPPAYGPPQSNYGQPPQGYGQPPHDQPPYSQPPQGYGQPPYGQPPQGYGQPAYGAPPQVAGLPPGVAPGGLGRRLVARIIDGLILLPVTLAAFAGSSGDDVAKLAGTSLVVVLVAAAYEILMISRRGATVGKKAMGLKVVRLADGTVPDTNVAAKRYALFGAMNLLSVLAPIFGILVIVVMLSPLFDNSGRRQGWWDKIAGTVAIRA